MILDNRGQPVWLRLLQNEGMDVMDFKAQTYKGEGAHLVGRTPYRLRPGRVRDPRPFLPGITRVRAGNGYEGDHHEFLISPEDTALITIYSKVPRDLSGVGGPVERASCSTG